MKYTYHKDGSMPKETWTVFVFGSNLAGIHGAGAAKVANKIYDRPYGTGVGFYQSCNLQESYAIPTKNEKIRRLSLDEIQKHVDTFIEFAYNNSSKTFFVTRVGCGLAGYLDSEIAPMFRGCNQNCNFPEQWKQYLE